MSCLQSPAQLSLAEFLELPETKSASEYIDGAIYQKPMPKGKHSRLQTRLSAEINRTSESKLQPVHLPNYTVPLEVAQLFQI
jgi:Uma2 family endonuclease